MGQPYCANACRAQVGSQSLQLQRHRMRRVHLSRPGRPLWTTQASGSTAARLWPSSCRPGGPRALMGGRPRPTWPQACTLGTWPPQVTLHSVLPDLAGLSAGWSGPAPPWQRMFSRSLAALAVLEGHVQATGQAAVQAARHHCRCSSAASLRQHPFHGERVVPCPVCLTHATCWLQALLQGKAPTQQNLVPERKLQSLHSSGLCSLLRLSAAMCSAEL